MRTIVLTPIVIACCLACGTNTSDQKRIIAGNRNSFNQAIANHDTSAMVPYWSEDITVITSRNTRFIGKHQYANGLAKEFGLRPDVVYVRTSETIEIFPDWDMAAESGRWIGTWKSGDEKIEVTGTYYAKWKKINDRWLITAEVYTPLRCKGSGYCDDVPK